MFGWLKRKKKQELVEPPLYSPPKLMPLTNLEPVYRAEIERLESHLSKLIAETEALAQLKLVEWKICKAEERRAWLEKGVTFPKSSFDSEQDKVFHALEQKLRREETEALERLKEVEREERRAIESQQRAKEYEAREAEKLEDQRRVHELEVQRIEAQKVVAAKISEALAGDLS